MTSSKPVSGNRNLMRPSDIFRKGTPVHADGKLGHTTGTTRPCLSGCIGPRIGIRWPIQEGETRSRITWPCSKTLHLDLSRLQFDMVAQKPRDRMEPRP